MNPLPSLRLFAALALAMLVFVLGALTDTRAQEDDPPAVSEKETRADEPEAEPAAKAEPAGGFVEVRFECGIPCPITIRCGMNQSNFSGRKVHGF